MASRDKGVHPGLHDRHFGQAGAQGTDGRTKKARSAIMRHAVRKKQDDVKALARMQSLLPKKPPSSSGSGEGSDG
jgi:hypothetical protein